MEKHHRILRQILCKNTKFQINRIKYKDAMFKTTHDGGHDGGHGHDDYSSCLTTYL